MKSNAKLLLATVVPLLFAITTGCKKDPGEFYDTFEIVSGDAQFVDNTLFFDWERQTVTFVVVTETATGKWTAICPTDDLWLTIVHDRNQLIVTVAENRSTQSRSSWIEFSLGDQRRRIDVHQRHMRYLDFEAGTAITISSAANEISLPLITNIPIEDLTVRLQQPADWISSLRLESNNVLFNVSQNTLASTRQATIIVEGDNRTASITVTQNAIGMITGAETNVCPETTVLLSIEVPDTDIFQWYRNGSPITGATNSTYTVTQTGTYTVSFGSENTMSLPKDVTIVHCERAYEDFLGTYTMWFHNNTGVPPDPRTHSITVTLVEDIPGETYHLKGILSPADELLGNIVVRYDLTTRGLELRGQKLFTREEGARRDFWLSPEGWYAPSGRGRSNPTNAQQRGLISANYTISERMVTRFELVHLGELWPMPADGTSGVTCRGFGLENFTSDTDTSNGAAVNGASGQSRHASMIFIRQQD
jgi:hypothetical protein